MGRVCGTQGHKTLVQHRLEHRSEAPSTPSHRTSRVRHSEDPSILPVTHTQGMIQTQSESPSTPFHHTFPGTDAVKIPQSRLLHTPRPWVRQRVKFPLQHPIKPFQDQTAYEAPSTLSHHTLAGHRLISEASSTQSQCTHPWSVM